MKMGHSRDQNNWIIRASPQLAQDPRASPRVACGGFVHYLLLFLVTSWWYQGVPDTAGDDVSCVEFVLCPTQGLNKIW
jgi:hypothetical protein